MIELSVIVPAYNEQENIAECLKVVSGVLEENRIDHEILVVDDASKDGTADVVTTAAKKNCRVRLVRHERNFGPGSGIATGMKQIQGEFVIFIPADIAIEPKDIVKMVEMARINDIVIGVRSDRADYTAWRKFQSQVNIWLLKFLFNVSCRDFNYISMYRVSAFSTLPVRSKGVFITGETIVRAHFRKMRIVECVCGYIPRKHGKTSTGSAGVVLKTIADIFSLYRERVTTGIK